MRIEASAVLLDSSSSLMKSYKKEQRLDAWDNKAVQVKAPSAGVDNVVVSGDARGLSSSGDNIIQYSGKYYLIAQLIERLTGQRVVIMNPATLRGSH